MKRRLSALFIVIWMLGGCTKAILATYDTGVELQENGITGKDIAVYEFEDTRAWIDSGDQKSSSFIGKQGAWRFGLKYNGVEFQPVSSILQDVFIKEFKSVGVNAHKGSGATSASYSLKGKILNFEFENEAGVWTVTSRRHVSLALTLEDKDGKPLLASELFNEVSRENEGMGVMHSTNVDKLMKDVLKQVVVNVINRTNQELSFYGFETINVSLNGVELDASQLVTTVAALSTVQ